MFTNSNSEQFTKVIRAWENGKKIKCETDDEIMYFQKDKECDFNNSEYFSFNDILNGTWSIMD